MASRRIRLLAAMAAAVAGILYISTGHIPLDWEAIQARDRAAAAEAAPGFPEAQAAQLQEEQQEPEGEPTPVTTPSPDGATTPTPTAQPSSSVTPLPSPTPTPTTSPAMGPEFPVRSDLPAEPGEFAEADIDIEGGRIISPDGRVVIDFPAEAVREPLRVRITHRNPRDFPPIPDHPFMTTWEFTAFAPERSMAPVREFPAPVRISVDYTWEDLEGRNEQTLRLWTLNEETGRWEPLESGHEDYTTKVTAEVDHFSVYGGTADPNVIAPPFLEAYQTDLHSGASTVTVPIEVPAGRNEAVTPNLTLVYSSNLTNEMKSRMSQASWVGNGWSLGTPSITQVFSDEIGEPNRFFLSMGNVSDEILKGDDGVWRTRHHEWLKIEQVGSCDDFFDGEGTPCYWKVWDKSGNHYVFGGSLTGPHPNAARYYTKYWQQEGKFRNYYHRWDLRVVQDLHGNTMVYEYWQHMLSHCPAGPCNDYVFAAYPSKITYSGIEITFALGCDHNPGIYPNTCIRLDSPHNIDEPECPPMSIGGNVEETRRLNSIAVKKTGSQAGLIRKYEFGYTTTQFDWPDCEPTVGRHQLDWVRMKGKDGATQLWQMNFTYQLKHFGFYYSDGSQDQEFAGFNRYFLTQATNGFGGTASFTYGEKRQSPTQTGENTWSRQVVTNRALNEGLGSIPDMTTIYLYDTAGPQYRIRDDSQGNPDYWNEEYRGFDSVAEVAADGDYVHHFYYTTSNDWPFTEEILTGREYETRFYEQGGTEWAEKSYSWGFTPIEQGPCAQGVCLVNFVHLDSVQEWQGQGGGTGITTEYEYDEYGFPVVERQLGWGFSGDERTIWRARHHGTGKWRFPQKWERTYEGSWTLSELRAGGPALQQALLEVTDYFYDGSSNKDVLESGPSNLTGIHLGDWGAGVYADQYFEYDSYGNRTAESVPTHIRIDQTGSGSIPSGVPRTTIAYDSDRHVFPVSVTDPMGLQTTINWDTRMSLPTAQSEANGQVWNYRYDVFGRLTKAWDVVDSEQYPTVQHVYEWSGAAPNHTLTVNRWGAGTLKFTSEMTCVDGFGRTFETRKSFKSGIDAIIETDYNASGQQRAVSEPFEATSEECNTAQQALAWTQYEYDPLGNVAVTTNPDGSTRETILGNLTTTTTDENGNRRVYRRDGQGRTYQVDEYTQAQNGGGYNLYASTMYEHDLRDNLTGVTDALGNQTTVQYDILGRKTQMTDPDMGTWQYWYDTQGNLTQQLDPRGQYVAMLYDDNDRITAKCHTDVFTCAGQPVPEYEYIYDQDQYGAGCTTPAAAAGQQTAAFDNASSLPSLVFRCYDERGRVTRERLSVIPAGDYELVRNFDSADRVIDEVYIPDTSGSGEENEWLEYEYDPTSGLPTRLSSNGYDYVSDATYDAAFRPLTTTFGNGHTTTNQYDSRGRLTGTETSGSMVAQDLSYTYDPAGNVKTMTDEQADESFKYCYDDLNRLTTVFEYTDGPPPKCDDPASWTYEYDQIGNLTRNLEPGLPYTDISHAGGYKSRIEDLSPGTHSFQYDDAGNMVSRTVDGVTTTLTYDAENRLASQASGGATTTYTYGASDELVTRTAGGGTTIYFGGRFEVNTTTGVVTKYYFFNGQRIAMRQDGTLRYLLSDHLGSTTKLLSETGTVFGSQTYYPFGRTRSVNGIVNTDKLFTGYQQEGALYFAQARFYDPTLGRFTQGDTIVPDEMDPQAWNRYAYVTNNPLKYVDPSGMCHTPDCIINNPYTNEPQPVRFAPRPSQDPDPVPVPTPPTPPDEPPLQTPGPPPVSVSCVARIAVEGVGRAFPILDDVDVLLELDAIAAIERPRGETPHIALAVNWDTNLGWSQESLTWRTNTGAGGSLTGSQGDYDSNQFPRKSRWIYHDKRSGPGESDNPSGYVRGGRCYVRLRPV